MLLGCFIAVTIKSKEMKMKKLVLLTATCSLFLLFLLLRIKKLFLFQLLSVIQIMRMALPCIGVRTVLPFYSLFAFFYTSSDIVQLHLRFICAASVM